MSRHPSAVLATAASKHHQASARPTVLATPTKYQATTLAPPEDDLPTEILTTGLIAKKVFGAQIPMEDFDGETSSLSPSTSGRLLTVRQSPISAARYNRWVVGEKSRSLGDQVRVEMEVLRSTRQEEDYRHRAKGAYLSQQARIQMVKDREQIDIVREENLEKAHRVRADKVVQKEIERAQKAEWMQRGKSLAIKDQLQRQKIKQVVGENSQRVAELTALAKQEEIDFERNLRIVRDSLLHVKRAETAAVRAATSDGVIDVSRRYAYAKRKELAVSTRVAQQTWREERSQSERSHLAKARANKAAAEASRKKAKELREKLEAERRAEAAAARERQRRDKAEKEKAIMFNSGGIRDVHDHLYRDRYVPEKEAHAMMSSRYLKSVAGTRLQGE